MCFFNNTNLEREKWLFKKKLKIFEKKFKKIWKNPIFFCIFNLELKNNSKKSRRDIK